MRLSIQYASQFRAVVGGAEETIECAGPCSLRTVLDQLIARHGGKLGELLFTKNGELQGAVMVCINDEQTGDALDATLEDGDEILLLSAISGG